VSKMERNIVSAIKSQPHLTLDASEGGLVAIWKHAATQIKYIEEQTNWHK
jgi:hypothetical protein